MGSTESKIPLQCAVFLNDDLHMEDLLFEQVKTEFEELILADRPVIVGIDGRCGSGKTSFAEMLRKHFPCNVLHMDDFYLPFRKRQPDWMEIPGGNMDFERLRRELLLPLRAGEQAYYHAYVCPEDKLMEPVKLTGHKLTVVEGSYSHHPSMQEDYDLRIFLTCSPDVQRSRLKKREGSNFSGFEEKWIPMEERYFQRFDIEANSHLVINTDEFFR